MLSTHSVLLLIPKSIFDSILFKISQGNGAVCQVFPCRQIADNSILPFGNRQFVGNKSRHHQTGFPVLEETTVEMEWVRQL
jgi:hypothetical protein